MAYYYSDYTNGNDSSTGLRIPVGDNATQGIDPWNDATDTGDRV